MLRAQVAVVAASRIYESDPVGYTDQPRFWNLVLAIETELGAHALLERIIEIERALGRERSFRNAPRNIDIDILLYGDAVLAEPGLTIPHPRMTQRAFVLKPLLELAPELTDPATGQPYRDLAPDQLEYAEPVQLFEE
jgi:2-amino-4-hydroxy-6-hydroxymethyldihydropteridine diphosphokinase